VSTGALEGFDASIVEPVLEDGQFTADQEDSRFGAEGKRDLRGRTARGIVVNAVFLIALNILGFLKGFGVAAFISPSDYGVWGLLGVTFTTLFRLVQVGVDDKYIQQDNPDQEAAFQEAFTLQCILCGAFFALMLASMPLYAIAYQDWQILLPGYILALSVPAMALQAPLWTYYRKMDYLRQRTLQAYEPVVSFVVTLVLAAGGAGYWSLVIGVVVGTWTTALVAVRASPYALRMRYRRGTFNEYWTFSAPLFYSALIVVLIGQVPTLVAKHSVGLLGLGAIAMAGNISQYANRIDDIVTNTLYPAVCAVKDRADLLQESFMKSNRLALLWAAPFGAGVVLFAPDIVHHLFGHRWHGAVYPLQAFGLAAAINQIAFNWTAFHRALGDTKPIAHSTTVMGIGVLGIAVPLLITHGVNGYATGMGLAILLMLAARLYFLSKLFPLRGVLANTLHGILPTLPAVLVVVGLRMSLWGGPRGAEQFIGELAVFVVCTAAVTMYSERALLREFRASLGGGREASAVPA